MTWDGTEHRRHTEEKCIQDERMAKMELTIDGTIKQLADIKLTLARLEAMLGGKIEKYDDHVKNGDWVNRVLSGVMIGGLVSVGIWVGTIQTTLNRSTIDIKDVSVELRDHITHDTDHFKKLGVKDE